MLFCGKFVLVPEYCLTAAVCGKMELPMGFAGQQHKGVGPVKKSFKALLNPAVFLRSRKLRPVLGSARKHGRVSDVENG